MKYLRSLLVWTGGAIGLIAAIPALAIGTPAGTTVDNSVSLDYSVNGFAQTQQTASVQFVVDRALATMVQAQGANAVEVTPGQTSAAANGYPALNFDVTNTGNATQDLWLAVIDQGNTAVTGLSGLTGAAFASSNVIVAVDTNTNGTFEAGTDTVLSLSGNHYVLPAVIANDTTRILVVVDVPGAAANGAFDTFTLVAGVADGSGIIGGDTNGHNAPGFAVATNDADVIGTEQNVFADNSSSDAEDATWDFNADAALGAQDALYNGQHSDSFAFIVRRAQLYVGKTVEVLWDPVNGNKYQADNDNGTTTANPKAIPGAVLMYVVGVQNDTGSVAATGVTINDDLQNAGIAVGNPGTASVFVPDTVNVTLNGSPVALDVPNSPNLDEISYRTCAAPGTVQAVAFGGGDPEVSAALGDCAANETGVIVYFVTVQ
jgi:hypothetical protein